MDHTLSEARARSSSKRPGTPASIENAPYSVVFRLLALLLLVAAELVITTTLFDGASLLAATGPAAWLREWGPWVLRFLVGFAAIFLGFTFLRESNTWGSLSETFRQSAIRWPLLLFHLCAYVLFLWLGREIYGGNSATAAWIIPWVLLGLLAGAAGVFAFASLRAWVTLSSGTGALWVWAAAGSLLACWTIRLTQTLWVQTARITFELVRFVLNPLLPDLRGEPDIMRLSTSGFGVRIAPECSGLEGMALLLVLGTLWLAIFRREYRFPQALLLLPIGLAALFLANVVRLALLILIGAAGARDIAMGGFHSQAGWISFNIIAFGLCVLSRRVAWATVHVPTSSPADSATAEGHEAGENPVAPFLIPFLAMLAASMLSGAMSGSFEWFFPLRLVAAAAAIWYYRASYRDLTWSFGWVSVLIGLGVFGFWMAMDALTSAGPLAMPQPLADASTTLRWGWITLRVLSAVVATPIAEELAFRGFILRRLVQPDFEAVTTFRSGQNRGIWIGLAGSSLIFGLLHGGHWAAGSIAGAVFGFAMLRKGRIGEATMAHAITNACLAAAALSTGRWDLWG